MTFLRIHQNRWRGKKFKLRRYKKWTNYLNKLLLRHSK